MNDADSAMGAVCDDFYVSCRLFLRLDMPLERETVLHFIDRIRKEYPNLKKLRRREGRSIVVEEEAEDHVSRRWIRLDPNSLRFGHFAPNDLEEVRKFCDFIVTQAPYHLTFSDIDYDHLEVVYGFDLEYRGNHDQLVAETILGDHSSGGFLFGDRVSHIIDVQPYYGVCLTPECDLQAYVEVKSRTTSYEVRSSNYDNEPITTFLTIRKYWNKENTTDLAPQLEILFDTADELATDCVVPNVVNPLAAAISSRS